MIDASATLTIASIAAGGDGVGRTEGVVVFVPRTAPGDVARVRLARSKRFARGELLGLEAASPARVDPPCPHYTGDRCGGCQIQHLSYDAQLAAKRTIIGDSLRRIGRRDVADPEVEPSDVP
ncbi:MAG TPA: TRAM domain-containing protein, partial [Gemmatimonadaceae bacterium]